MTAARNPSRANADDLAELRQRNERVRELLQEWLADESGNDRKVWPTLAAEMEMDPLSRRKRLQE